MAPRRCIASVPSPAGNRRLGAARVPVFGETLSAPVQWLEWGKGRKLGSWVWREELSSEFCSQGREKEVQVLPVGKENGEGEGARFLDV